MPEFSPLRDYHLHTSIDDISAAGGKGFVPVPSPGKVIEIRVVIHNAITSADAVLTASINGTAITDGAVTVAFSGSAEGDTFVIVPSAANSVQEGDALKILTDNGSSTLCKAEVTFVIRK